MSYMLIADAGSTKTDWVLLDKEGLECRRLITAGINAAIMSDPIIFEILENVGSDISDKSKIDCVYFYGAGCATQEIKDRIESLLKTVLPSASKIEVESDMLGAARALLGDSPGIACILGTGSNSCKYDGKEIVQSVPSLGFILGDEAGGAALGKQLLTSAFKGLMPEPLKESLFERYNLDYGTVIENVYRGSAPSAYLASFVPFILENIDRQFIRDLVDKEFNRFFVNNILRYEGLCELPVAFAGGVAYHFKEFIKSKLDCLVLNEGKIIERPLEALIDYHRLKLKSLYG